MDNELIINLCKEAVEKIGGILFDVYISGSIYYKWNSHNSDIDVRGTYVLPKESFLGVTTPSKHEIRWDIEIDGVEYDFVLREIAQEMRLALKGNYNTFEGFVAPHIYEHPVYPMVRKDIFANLLHKGVRYGPKDTQGIFGSYMGMSFTNHKKYIKNKLKNGETPDIKKYLYVFRGLLSCIYTMRTGHIQADMEELLKFNKVGELYPLLEYKRAGDENAEMPNNLSIKEMENMVTWLRLKAETEYPNCKLPEYLDESAINELNKIIVATRSLIEYY